jgi:polysaccharide export outer membrane protein
MKWVNRSPLTVLIPRLFLPVAMVALAAPALLGQQTNLSTLPAARPSTDKQMPLNPEVAARLLIGPGDMLTITIFNVPELQQTARVSESGDAVLSLIGNMHLAGMTVANAAVALEDEYRNRKLLVDPHVTVLVTEYATEGISVLGEVARPGVYPLLGPHSLLDIISAAGGLTASAGSTVTIRRRNGPEQVVQLDANDPQKALAQDVELQPADMVVVARAAVVYVVGDVGRPGGFSMQNNGRLTVLQAIALASGVNKTAALSHAKIIHKTPSGYAESDIHLAQLLQDKAPDLALAPEDIVFVPNSKLKSAVAGGYTSVIQAAATAAVYAFRP